MHGSSSLAVMAALRDKPKEPDNVVQFSDYQRKPEPAWPPADMLEPVNPHKHVPGKFQGW